MRPGSEKSLGLFFASKENIYYTMIDNRNIKISRVNNAKMRI